MNLYNIHEAYEILGLEDPISFQQNALNYYLKEMHNGDEYYKSDVIFRERFLFLRQTGRTTFKCIDAALRLLRGRNVMFVSHSMRTAKFCEEKIKKYAWDLGHENQVQYSNLGRLEVRAANNSERLELETVGWGGDIIIDIY
jgi:hypothetical protein